MNRCSLVYWCLWHLWNIVPTGLFCRMALRKYFPSGTSKGIHTGSDLMMKEGHSVDGDRIWIKDTYVNVTVSEPFLTQCSWTCARDSWWMFLLPHPNCKRQNSVMSLLLLMQTSCVALRAAWDLHTVCERAQMYVCFCGLHSLVKYHLK